VTNHPIRFEWYDYMARPIPEGFVLPDDLDKRVSAWGREGDARIYQDEGSVAWNEWMVDWMKRGRALAVEVSEVLDRPVDYLYEMTQEVERIEPLKKPLVRRHHRPSGN
jgi:hypothetical protein